MPEKKRHTNSLIHESSPYLLQHAHNPVNWLAWNEDSLAKAKNENKLILISVGYSACHWCHVMEHESFEDETVARIMNDHFICIKVDREERPDIDQVYMTAVQLMTGHGGWPLNCFALPDGRPVYGGTYFPKANWQHILLTLADLFKHDPDKMFEYADKLTDGIKKSELIKINTGKADFNGDNLETAYKNWSTIFDNMEGGPNKAPKFPMPNNYLFLLRYCHYSGNKEALNHLQLTLKKMAFGGIYDQLGGGFSRYSTDNLWKVPHFEKMLYDNAQLVSLYSEAYQFLRDPLYKQVVYETLDFIKRELSSEEGAFYSALDADSEGVEGKYYVWSSDELENILKDDFKFFAEYFNINEEGYWEDENYILLRKKEDSEIASHFNLNEREVRDKIEGIKKNLLLLRGKRVRPGLDDKCLTSWNALMLKGYLDAYNAFGEKRFLEEALKNAEFILTKQLRPDGGLNHSYKNGKSTINGYLEDYAFVIEAFISLYECAFDEKWLMTAKNLIDYTISHFYDQQSGMFYFTSDLDPALITRKMEITDNVTPASNSSLAKALFICSHYFDKQEYFGIAKKMLNNVQQNFIDYPPGYSNWGILFIYFISSFYEIAIVGKDVDEKRKEFNKHYYPNRIFAGTKTKSRLPLLRDKQENGPTAIYVCVNKSCGIPVNQVDEAILQIKN